MVFRVVETVAGPVKGLIGPWGHVRPEGGVPGPAIGFLQECVRFFAASLDEVDNGFFDEPRLISYLQEAVAPGGSYAERPGRWVADASWPSPTMSEERYVLGAHRLLADGEADEDALPLRLCSLQTTGMYGGLWCGDGSAADFALDQRPDDGASLCWDTEPLTERLEVLGRGWLRLKVSVDRPQALIAVLVCDVAPDGASTLVAQGVLNLSRREGRDRTTPMPVNQPVSIEVPLQSAGYAIPAGHRVRVAVSNTYWPWVWPAPEASGQNRTGPT